MERIKVEDHPDLYRDIKSKAIINKNKSEYENYMKTYRSRLSEKEKINNIETDLNDLKNQINEIKDLLSQLVNK